MAVEVTDMPALTPSGAAPSPAQPSAVAEDPPARPRSRHRRPLSLIDVAERAWRPPLALSVAIFAACGPAHALGHTELVYHAVLVGLALSACAVPVGFLASRHDARSGGR